jgi:hypothetical protein
MILLGRKTEAINHGPMGTDERHPIATHHSMDPLHKELPGLLLETLQTGLF